MAAPLVPRAGARVAVIGAGPAGLAATRYFVEAGYDTHTFEATSNLGGTWVYSPTPRPSSAIYKSLRCNIPSQTMAFSDFPFPQGTSTFPSHQTVLAYLHAYAKHHRLHQYISFDSPVTDVRKERKKGDQQQQQQPQNGGDDNEEPMWRLIVPSATPQHQFFHAVVVCAGHFSKPRHWNVPGFEHLAANGIPVQHSCDYREPSRYAGKNVLVVGAGPSGTDLALELTTVARSVVLAHNRNRVIFRRPPKTGNFRELTRPRRILPNGDVELIDDTLLRDIEMVLECTGFYHSTPFVHVPGPPAVEPAPHGKNVRGLSALCVARCDPTLAMIGLPQTVVPFGLCEDQIEFFRAVLEGRVSHERLAQWDGEEEEYVRVEGGGCDRNLLMLGARQWEYRRRLTRDAGREPVAPCVIEMYSESAIFRNADVTTFRQYEFHMLGPGPGEWRLTLDGKDVTGLRPDDL